MQKSISITVAFGPNYSRQEEILGLILSGWKKTLCNGRYDSVTSSVCNIQTSLCWIPGPLYLTVGVFKPFPHVPHVELTCPN